MAFAAIVATVITTLMTLRDQRNLRLRDTALAAAVDFLAAADRTYRTRQRAAELYAQLARATQRANELNAKFGEWKQLGEVVPYLDRPLLEKALEGLVSVGGGEQAEDKISGIVSAWVAHAEKDLVDKDHKKAEEVADAAYEDAEKAYTTVRLLIPSATKQARRYLNLCNQAAGGETANKEQEDARQEVEETIRQHSLNRYSADNRGTGKPAQTARDGAQSTPP